MVSFSNTGKKTAQVVTAVFCTTALESAQNDHATGCAVPAGQQGGPI